MTPGTTVAVRTLGQKRGVVVAVGNGRYRVRVEGMVLWCQDDDLTVVQEPAGKKRPADRAARPVPASVTGEGGVPAGRVDLHGLRADEAMSRVTHEIDRALLRGADRVEVVHGKGSGRLRDALRRHVSSLRVVKSVKLDPGNPGVTWLYF